MTNSQELKQKAQLEEDAGDYFRSRELFEAALLLDEKELGVEHSDLIEDLFNLALTCVAIDDFVAARKYFERVLKMQQKVLGPNHEDVVETKFMLRSIRNLDQAGAKKLARFPDSQDQVENGGSIQAVR